MKRSRTGYTIWQGQAIPFRLTEKVSLELGFKTGKSLSKGKTIPGDRANVIKGALSLELLASVRNSES